MKKIEVLKSGETKLHEVKMNEKQVRDYVAKVSDYLNALCEKWDLTTCNDHQNPTFEGVFKAMTYTENVLETERTIKMRFAFTKVEHCAIYLAFCFGAFDCLDLVALTDINTAVVAMLKVLTSRKARTEILSNC